MKRLLPLLILLGAAAYIGIALRPAHNETAFDLVGFSRLPVLANGRIKPFDTIARSSLLQLQGRQRVSTPDQSEPLVASPTEWLLDVFFRPEKADTYPTFAIDNPELLQLIGKSEDDLRIQYSDTTKKVLAIVGFLPSHHRRFSFNDISPHVQRLQEQAQLAQAVESAVRSPFQSAVLQLYGNVYHYVRLKHALVAPGRKDFLGDLLRFQENVASWVAAFNAKRDNQPYDQAAYDALIDLGDQFGNMDRLSNFLVVPPEPGASAAEWKTTGAALLETLRTGRVPAAALAFAGLAQSWREQRAERFNKILELYRADLEKRFGPDLVKSNVEARFNSAEPFMRSMNLYAIAFFLAIGSWVLWPQTLARAAFWLVAAAWIATTAGIATRMWLEGRPPVTNLYSSALFIGWGAVGLALIAVSSIMRHAAEMEAEAADLKTALGDSI